MENGGGNGQLDGEEAATLESIFSLSSATEDNMNLSNFEAATVPDEQICYGQFILLGFAFASFI